MTNDGGTAERDLRMTLSLHEPYDMHDDQGELVVVCIECFELSTRRGPTNRPAWPCEKYKLTAALLAERVFKRQALALLDDSSVTFGVRVARVRRLITNEVQEKA